VNEPLATEIKELARSGLVERIGQNVDWRSESVFAYPPAKGDLLLTLGTAPIYFCFGICFISAVMYVLGGLFEKLIPQLGWVFAMLLLTGLGFALLYLSAIWMYRRLAECFDWDIRVGISTIYFPPKIRPASWRSGWVHTDRIPMVKLVSDTSRTVPYEIDEDKRYAHLLVFERIGLESISLKLDEMSKASRDKFLLALSRVIPAEKLSAELQVEIESIETLTFNRNLAAGNLAGKQRTSSDALVEGHHFTQWWQKDFERALLATNYVPLSPGHPLQEGRFVIDNYLASGGQSTTYLSHSDDGALVVVKECVVAENVDPAVREKAHQLFSREARLLMKCNHPRIACILDHFTENARDYLVTEYIEGRTLRDVVRELGPQSETVVLKWALSVVELFIYLHSMEQPITHRDVSPDNLIVGSENDIFLIDFGAANDDIGNLTGTMIGKQCYMAPEQFRGKAIPASDIYAFGGTLYFLLTAQDPVPLSVCHAKEVRQQISSEMDDLISTCTGQSSEIRPDGAKILELLKNWAAVSAPRQGQ
jgi:tRNA A-37 threonylcarbamoyl transferase component Bud32